MGLRISSRYLCAFKLPLIKCLLSVAYACSYRNPTATMGHSVHNVDISKPLALTMPYTRLDVLCNNQLLDMPLLSGGWIILAKQKCSPTDVNKNAKKCFLKEIRFLCIWNISGNFYFSSRNMGPTLDRWLLYFCTV